MIKIEIEVKCPYCDSNDIVSNDIVRNGKVENNKQRYLCKNKECHYFTQ